MYDAPSDFRDAIRAAGLEPPDVIEPGKLYRFPGAGKRNGNTAGWCKLFDDGLGGCFGDWSSGFAKTWQSKRAKPESKVEREPFKRHVAQAQAQAERKARQTEAATTAAAIWNAAAPAPVDHPYLVRKGVQANGARLHNGRLLIPMREGSELHSLQFIGPEGDKQFLSGGRVAGCYFSIGNVQGAVALCVAEGFATGATIHQATSYSVAIAFNTRNLKAVARAMRARFPALPLIVCADDDAATCGNPGLTKANKAARAVGWLLAVPDFGHERPPDASDFNDMAAARGMAAVRHAITNAAAPNDGNPGNSLGGELWSEPQPLDREAGRSEPYPLYALPNAIGEAVREYQAYGQQPGALVASSALAVLSLAVQGLADMARDERLTGPLSLNFLFIAQSGECKTAVMLIGLASALAIRACCARPIPAPGANGATPRLRGTRNRARVGGNRGSRHHAVKTPPHAYGFSHVHPCARSPPPGAALSAPRPGVALTYYRSHVSAPLGFPAIASSDHLDRREAVDSLCRTSLSSRPVSVCCRAIVSMVGYCGAEALRRAVPT